MKDKSININIRNTNILKKDKKKRKRRSRDRKNKNKLPIGQPSQGASQPYVTSYPSFVGPQLPYNNDAMKHAEDYIAPRTNKNQLLLTNGEPETNKSKLLLTNAEPTIQSSTTKSITKSRPIQTPIKKSVIIAKSRPTQYTQEGLMKVKTLKELRELMKVAIPGIDNELLNKITKKNKSEAIKTFLSQYDKPSEPTPEPPKKSEIKPPRSFTSYKSTTSPKESTSPFESPPPTKFTSQTPSTTDTEDERGFTLNKQLNKLKKDKTISNLFQNPKNYYPSFFSSQKVSETPTAEVRRIETDNDSDNELFKQLTYGKGEASKSIAEQFIKNARARMAKNKASHESSVSATDTYA